MVVPRGGATRQGEAHRVAVRGRRKPSGGRLRRQAPSPRGRRRVPTRGWRGTVDRNKDGQYGVVGRGERVAAVPDTRTGTSSPPRKRLAALTRLVPLESSQRACFSLGVLLTWSSRPPSTTGCASGRPRVQAAVPRAHGHRHRAGVPVRVPAARRVREHPAVLPRRPRARHSPARHGVLPRGLVQQLVVLVVQLGSAAVHGHDQRQLVVRGGDVADKRADLPQAELPVGGERGEPGLGGAVHQPRGGGRRHTRRIDPGAKQTGVATAAERRRKRRWRLAGVAGFFLLLQQQRAHLGAHGSLLRRRRHAVRLRLADKPGVRVGVRVAEAALPVGDD